MSKFKIGDEIRCIEGATNITIGKTYIVTKEYSNYLEIKYDDNSNTERSFYDSHFELANKLIEEDMEDKTIEEIKEFDKSVLKEANEEVLEEIANEQKEQAKKALRSLYDEKAVLEKDTKAKNDKIEEITNDLSDISA